MRVRVKGQPHMSVNRLAVVTGASSGIGAETALALANAGFDVIAAARRTDRLTDLAKKSKRITALELDITDEESVNAFVGKLNTTSIDLLVNNAGGAFDASTIAEADIESWQRAYEVNVLGTVRMVKALLPLLIKSGHGHIINMSSTAGRVVYETGGSYTAAKHAETALTGTLRLELSGLPVRVTEIAPGMVKTDEFAVNRFGGDKEKAAAVYAGVEQPLTAADVAETVRWAATLPDHVNIDLLVVRPIAQAAQHKVHRTR